MRNDNRTIFVQGKPSKNMAKTFHFVSTTRKTLAWKSLLHNDHWKY